MALLSSEIFGDLVASPRRFSVFRQATSPILAAKSVGDTLYLPAQ